MSISEAPNVPGHEEVQRIISDGDNDKLVTDMVDVLRAMSDAASRISKKATRTCSSNWRKPSQTGTNKD